MHVVYKIVNHVNNKHMHEENKLINALLECFNVTVVILYL